MMHFIDLRMQKPHFFIFKNMLTVEEAYIFYKDIILYLCIFLNIWLNNWSHSNFYITMRDLKIKWCFKDFLASYLVCLKNHL